LHEIVSRKNKLGFLFFILTAGIAS